MEDQVGSRVESYQVAVVVLVASSLVNEQASRQQVKKSSPATRLVTFISIAESARDIRDDHNSPVTLRSPTSYVSSETQILTVES
jgi:hypothetical protein